MNVSSRWCVTAVFALGALACSDPVPPPAQGAFIASVGPPSPTISGKSCPTSSITYDVPLIRDQKLEEALTTSTYKHKTINGEKGAKVSCSVKGSSTFTFSGEIAAADRRFEIQNGTIGADGKGTASLALIKSGSPGHVPLNSSVPCNIVTSAPGANLQVKAGSMWATFDCAAMENPPANACSADGVFVLENCEQ